MNEISINIKPYLAKYITAKYTLDEILQNFVCSYIEVRPANCPLPNGNLTIPLSEIEGKNFISHKNQKKIEKKFYNLYISDLDNFIAEKKQENPKNTLTNIFYDFVKKYDISQYIDCEAFRKQYIRKIKK